MYLLVKVFSKFKNLIKDKVYLHNNQFQMGLFLVILCIFGLGTWTVKATAVHNAQLQTGISKKIIRFHVIANSDREEDQDLKYKVKDTLVNHLSPLLAPAQSLEDARNILMNHLPYIEELARATILEDGYNYAVTLSLDDAYFPMKVYGDNTFPPGIYQSLRVQIGAAQGENWWCLLFPPLCFVDETYSVVDENSQKKLKYMLTEEEYHSIKENKKPVKIKFKLWDSFKSFFKLK